jgi:hypothetical protein
MVIDKFQVAFQDTTVVLYVKFGNTVLYRLEVCLERPPKVPNKGYAGENTDKVVRSKAMIGIYNYTSAPVWMRVLFLLYGCMHTTRCGMNGFRNKGNLDCLTDGWILIDGWLD